ncbi:MAG: aminotransferase class I/II-fold pyridoxal phosphate-dependent enzyme, partial [Candidatus Omnitrophota bacterium]|nr:aminotransferase class I/II-fold pyridoxal phosphate-dependent enzyme [Candidatus Omnitrophota bacterium]
MIHEANRLKRLPPYLFTIVDDKKREIMNRGVDVIDLSMGSPDQPAPKCAIEELCKQARLDGNQRYSRRDGDVEVKLRKAIADWYMNRFGVSLDPESEVIPLIGSKEGIAHLSLAFLNNDDIALVPNPAYPVHFNGVIMAGGILYNVPLTPENNYMPALRNLSPEVIRM